RRRCPRHGGGSERHRGEAPRPRRVLRDGACEALFLAHCASFPLLSEPARRRTTVHGQFGPSARPLISSRVTVAAPRYDAPGAHRKNGPVSCQVSTSPLTRPSIKAIGAPSGPWASPLTLPPCCRSTQRVVRSRLS